MLEHLEPEPVISLDTDWFYRRLGSAAQALARGGLARADDSVGQVYDVMMRRSVLGGADRLRDLDVRVIDGTAVGVGRLTQWMSRGLTLAVSGHAQHYGLIMAIGILAAIALAVFGL